MFECNRVLVLIQRQQCPSIVGQWPAGAVPYANSSEEFYFDVSKITVSKKTMK